MKGICRDSSLTLTAGIMIIAALVLALQVGFAPAHGQDDIPDDAEIVFGETIPPDGDQDLTCTAGATGNCKVVYVVSAVPSYEAAIEACGAATCLTRAEFRW